MTEIIRTFEAEIDSVLDGERAVVARINTAAVDRLRTVIDPLGADTSHFNKTASVLWQHGLDPIRGTVPIGHGWVKVRRAEKDMLGKTKFGKDDFSNALFEGYKDGSIRGWSIKAGVQESSPPTREEIRSNPALSECEMIYRKWDLIEYSATPTPGNSDCLTLLVSRGLVTAPEGFVPTVKLVEQPIIVARYITHSGGKWIVHAEDGKVLGRHDSKAEAESQLGAIEAHKHEGRSAAHTSPYIERDGAHWYVCESTGHRVARYDDAGMAERCVKALQVMQPRFSEQLQASVVAVRGWADAQINAAIEMIDLRKNGRI